jgi:hypothetical protein
VIEFDKTKEAGGVYGDGHLLGDNYRWLISFYVFGFHIMFGRATRRMWPHTRFGCWLKTGHRREDNNLEDPTRRWWCRGCGTVWGER